MKYFSSKGALWVAALAVTVAGLIPFAASAWGHMYYYNRVVTAPYWCGSYYSSYPCNYSTYQYVPYTTSYNYNYNYSSSGYPNYQTYYYPNNYYPMYGSGGYMNYPGNYYYGNSYNSNTMYGMYNYGW